MSKQPVLSVEARLYVDRARVARLATADIDAVPQVVPVCFALDGDNVYITIDQKPKSVTTRPLKRLRNIAQNPKVCLIVDTYSDNWTMLGWVMLHGHATIVLPDSISGGAIPVGETPDNAPPGDETLSGIALSGAADTHQRAQRLLKARYKQYQEMALGDLPVISIALERSAQWGSLTRS
jgi:PPOX class probable F420-dependent enzyme